jgi:plastocyanin
VYTATAATGTINYDIINQSILYYTTNSSANWTINFRGNSTTTLNSMLQVGQAITATFLATNGSTAYYNSSIQIDSVGQTVKWQNVSPSSGNVNSIDVYSYTIIKTATTPTYTVLGSLSPFV